MKVIYIDKSTKIESLGKFHKEKKNIDSFLLDFKKEVIASQTAIWKELHNVKNILSGKPGSKFCH